MDYMKQLKKSISRSSKSFVKEILSKNIWNISITSWILWCSRKTIRWARDWILEDYSRAPLTPCINKTVQDVENLVLFERNITKYWRVRLFKHLQLKYWIEFSASTIWNIF